MGVDKPVLAIPGNHDWFNALDGFAANLMDPETARAAIDARVKADLSLSSTTGDRIDQLIGSAARLRSLYRLQAGLQHAPFFELHAGGFSLIAIDTGIERRVDAQTARVVQGGARTIDGRASRWRSSATRSTRPGDRRSATARSRRSTICCERTACG